jgi:hypothetical protein
MRKMALGPASAAESDTDMLNISGAIIRDILVKLPTSALYALVVSVAAMC